MWTVLDYMYRDAGNFKAFGTVILKGRLSAAERGLIRSRLASHEYFIAEQVDVPPLYGELYQWSAGPTVSDHCWRELVGFREVSALESTTDTVKSDEFLSRFAAAKNWDETLSAHFYLGCPYRP